MTTPFPKLIIFSILGFFILIAAGVGFFILGKSVKNTNTQQVTPEIVAQPGVIQGSLSYPSEGIPANMQVCAETLDHTQVKCVQGQNSTYSLEVNPGTYYVYAFLPDNPSLKAYFSEFVTCGLTVDCPSHSPIEVEVEAGGNILDIDPGDWYAQ